MHRQPMTATRAKQRRALEKAQQTLSGMSEESDPLLVAAKKQYDAAKAKYDTIARQQEDIDYKLIPYRDALDAAYEEYEKAYNTYSDALSSLEYTQAQNENSCRGSDRPLQVSPTRYPTSRRR